MITTTVADLVLAAQEFVRRAVKLELDHSLESLAYVDHYLSTVGEVEGAVLDLIAPAIGAYLGEIAIAQVGGRWNTVGDPRGWTVSLEPAPITFSPAGMTAEAIRTGPAEGYDGSLAVPAELEGPLEEALTAAGPVEERYYYSLTGRFETLQHAVEIIVELRRQRLDS